MIESKKRTTPQKGKKSSRDAEMSDAALNKVSGGNMPTSVEHGGGGGKTDASIIAVL